MWISSDDHTDSTKSDGEYDWEIVSDVDMRMQDDVDSLDSVDLDSNVDLERDDENDDDEEEADEKEEEVVDENEEEGEDEDEDEDNSKEPGTIVHGEMGNTLADHADTMAENEPTVLPEKVLEMCEHTTQPNSPRHSSQ